MAAKVETSDDEEEEEENDETLEQGERMTMTAVEKPTKPKASMMESLLMCVHCDRVGTKKNSYYCNWDNKCRQILCPACVPTGFGFCFECRAEQGAQAGEHDSFNRLSPFVTRKEELERKRRFRRRFPTAQWWKTWEGRIDENDLLHFAWTRFTIANMENPTALMARITSKETKFVARADSWTGMSGGSIFRLPNASKKRKAEVLAVVSPASTVSSSYGAHKLSHLVPSPVSSRSLFSSSSLLDPLSASLPVFPPFSSFVHPSASASSPESKSERIVSFDVPASSSSLPAPLPEWWKAAIKRRQSPGTINKKCRPAGPVLDN